MKQLPDRERQKDGETERCMYAAMSHIARWNCWMMGELKLDLT